MKFMLV